MPRYALCIAGMVARGAMACSCQVFMDATLPRFSSAVLPASPPPATQPEGTTASRSKPRETFRLTLARR